MLRETNLNRMNVRHRSMMRLLQNPPRDREQRDKDLIQISEFVESIPENLRAFPVAFMQMSYYLYVGYQYDFEHLCQSVKEEKISLEQFQKEMRELQLTLKGLLFRQRRVLNEDMALAVDLPTFARYLEMMIDLDTEIISKAEIPDLVMCEATMEHLSKGRYYWPGSPSRLCHTANDYAKEYPDSSVSVLMIMLRLSEAYSFPLRSCQVGMQLFRPIISLTIFHKEFAELCDGHSSITLNAYTRFSTSGSPSSLDIGYRALSRIMRKCFGERNGNIKVTPEECLVLAKRLECEYKKIENKLDDYRRDHLRSLGKMIATLDHKIQNSSNEVSSLMKKSY